VAVGGVVARRVVSSLYERNYRLYFGGQLVSVAGTWMQSVAQSFLVLDLTHSGTQLGLTTAARFGPMLLLGPLGGLFADRRDKRKVLYATQSAQAALAGVFAVLVATGSIRLWMVYPLAIALGFVNTFDNPARQAFISELVEPKDLANAVTLNSIAMNMARVFGGAAGGAVTATLGIADCFTANAVSFGAVLVSLAMMRGLRPPKPVRARRGQVMEGLRYVRKTPELLVPLLMVTIVGTLAWEFPVTLPLMATRVFGRGAAAYGLMSATMGIGACAGGLVAAARKRPGGLAVAAAGWGIAITLAALAWSMWLELVVLLFVGYGSITFNSYAKTELQLAAAPEMRGRVMSLWAMAWMGSTPIGGPIVGWIGQEVGARWALAVGGMSCLACGLLVFKPVTRLFFRQQPVMQGDEGPSAADRDSPGPLSVAAGQSGGVPHRA
jgi:MFS family permease